jgi:predicted CoA-binding protein
MSLRQEIDAFLEARRIAVAGVSTDPKHFSRVLFRDLLTRGYDLIAVNPKTNEVEGRRCYASVRNIEPPPEGVLIMTPPAQTNQIVEDCIASGVHRIWMHRGGGAGAVSLTAARLCRENGISVIPGECPYMFLPQSGFPHNAHGWMRKALHAELR